MVSREPNKLLKKFITDFSKLKLKKKTPTTEWTKRIHEYFVKLGKDEGFNTYCRSDPIEYLVDLCWAYEPEETPLEWLEVIFEIEFGGTLDSNLDEFDKLVDIKAYTKVLLCKSKVDEVDELLTQASERIRYNPLRLLEEHYLIIVITETRKRFYFSGFYMDCLGNMVPLGAKQFPKN